MEFSVNRTDLVRELSLARNVVEQKTTIPILSHVVFVTGDSWVDIYATDLELGIRCQCPATITTGGSCAIPAKRLLDYVRLLPDADVAIKVKVQDNHWASLSCGKSKARIAGLSRESFPELPTLVAPVANFPLAALTGAISKTIFAISKEESRFTLKGGLFVLSASGFTIVATDGHRMAVIAVKATDKWTCNLSDSVKEIIPLKAMTQLLALAKDSPEAEVSYSADDNHLFFHIGLRAFSARKLAGNFPDYERVLPKDSPHSVGLMREEFKGAVDRVSQFSDERSKAIRLKLTEGTLTAHSAVAETGDSEEAVDAVYTGPAIEMGLNSDYVLDFLRAVDTDAIRINLKDANSAAEFRISGDDSYRYVCMPMKI